MSDLPEDDFFQGDWTFEEGPIQKEVQIEEDVVVYHANRLVQDESEVGREVASLVTGAKSKTIADYVSMLFAELFQGDVEIAQTRLIKSLKSSFLLPQFVPIVTGMKHVTIYKSKRSEFRFVHERSIQHDPYDFIDAHRMFSYNTHQQPGRAFALKDLLTPVEQVSRQAPAISFGRDLDSIYVYDLETGANPEWQEGMRVLSDDKFEIVGVANHMYEDSLEDAVTFSLQEYISWIQGLKAGDKVGIIPHSHNAHGLRTPKKATVQRVSKREIVLETRDLEGIVFDTRSVQSILSNPFCIGDAKSIGNHFNKLWFFKYPCNVLFDLKKDDITPDVLISTLLPSIEEWMFVNKDEDDLKSKYSAKDIYAFLDTDKGVDHSLITETIANNLKNLPAPLKHPTSKQESKKLKSHARKQDLMRISKNAALTLELIAQLVGKDGDKASVMSEAYLERLKQLLEASKNMPPAVLDTNKLKAALEREYGKGRVFETLVDAYNALPDSNDERACVFNANTCAFYGLRPVTFKGRLFWMISLPEIQRACVKLQEAGFEVAFSNERHTLVHNRGAGLQWHAFVAKECFGVDAHALAAQSKSVTDLKKLCDMSLVASAARPLPKELHYVNPDYATPMEGDEDYADYEELYNNREFGANYTTINKEDVAIDDEEDESNDENTTLRTVKESLQRLIESDTENALIYTELEKLNQSLLVNCAIKLSATDQQGLYNNLLYCIDIPKFIANREQILSKLPAGKVIDPKRIARDVLYVTQKQSAIKTIYDYFALTVIMLQCSLPQVNLTPVPHPECKARFGVRGYPLEDESPSQELVTYVAHLIKHVVSSIPVYKLFETVDIGDIKAGLLEHISQILGNSAALNRRLSGARSRMQAVMNDVQTIKLNKVWPAFRPVLKYEESNKRAQENPIVKLHTSLQAVKPLKSMARASKSKTKSTGDAVVLDDIAPRLNSCCLQRLDKLTSIWGDEPTMTNDIAGISAPKHKAAYRLRAPKRHYHETFESQPIRQDKSVTHLEETVDAHINDSGQVQRLREFINRNEGFKDDAALERLVTSFEDKNVWSDFSKRVQQSWEALAKGLDDKSLASTIKEEILDGMLQYASQKDPSLMCNMLHKYLAADLPTFFARCANAYYKSDANYISSKSMTLKDQDKQIATKHINESESMKFLSIYETHVAKNHRTFAEVPGAFMNDVHTLIFQNSKTKEATYGVYVYLYLILQVITRHVAHLIGLKDWMTASFQDIIDGLENNAASLKQFILLFVAGILRVLKDRNTISYAMHFRSLEEYEKQREDLKQEALNKLKVLDKEAKRIYRKLKARGIKIDTELLVDTDAVAEDEEGDAGEEETTQPEQRENEEVEQAIIMNKGENDDDDSGDEGEYF